MKKSISEKIIFVLGVYLFVLGVVAIFNAILNPEIANFLWLCYIALLLIGIGMMIGNSLLIITQLNIYLIPIIVWNIDFFYQLFTKTPLLGITDYLFIGGLNSLGNFISLQHIYLFPLAIYAVYKIGLKSKKAWMISFLEIFILFWLSLLTSADKNTNCVFRSCVNFIPLEGLSYQILWFVFMFVSILFVNFLLTSFLFKKK